MKKTATEIRNLITLMSMVMFIYFAFEGLTALEDKRELSREAECAKCCGENCGSDGCAACVVPSDEIEKHEKDVGVGTRKDRKPPEMVASEHKRVLDDDESHMGEKNPANLFPMNNRVHEKTGGRHDRSDDRNHVIIESHRNLLLCLVCLYLILLPVVFRNIIPNTTDK